MLHESYWREHTFTIAKPYEIQMKTAYERKKYSSAYYVSLSSLLIDTFPFYATHSRSRELSSLLPGSNNNHLIRHKWIKWCSFNITRNFLNDKTNHFQHCKYFFQLIVFDVLIIESSLLAWSL